MKSNVLNQYKSECRDALNSTARLSKTFEKFFMDAIPLYMTIHGRVNFLQMGRYGKFSEQTYRNNFENDRFDWMAFNSYIADKVLTGQRRAIAIDPSYIPKAGKKTPWIGYFWSGQAQAVKRGLEIMGIGLVDADNKDCIVLQAQQTPDTVTLDNMYKNLIDWYVATIRSKKESLVKLSSCIVADAFFSKSSFVNPVVELGFDVISRLRNDAVMFYPTLKERTGKRGRPQLYDGKVDFTNLDTSRCEQHEADKGLLYSMKAYSKPLKRMVKLVIWYPDESMKHWQLYFSTDTQASGKDVLDIYRTRFQLEFCFRDSKQHTGLTHCQSTSINKLAFNFNASLTSVNLAKAACKSLGLPFSITTCQSVMHNAFLLERFICVSGIDPNPHLIDKLIKELVVFAATAA